LYNAYTPGYLNSETQYINIISQNRLVKECDFIQISNFEIGNIVTVANDFCRDA